MRGALNLLGAAVIIAVIIFLLFNFAGKIKGDVHDKTRLIHLQQLKTALFAYESIYQKFPTQEEFFDDKVLVSAGLIGEIPVDPETKGKYMYVSINESQSCDNFHLGVKLNKTSSALDSDSDFDSNTSRLCGVSKYGRGFSGEDVDLVLDYANR